MKAVRMAGLTQWEKIIELHNKVEGCCGLESQVAQQKEKNYCRQVEITAVWY